MRGKLFFPLTFFLFLIILVSGDTFIDDTSSGTYTRTFYNASGFTQINTTYYYNGTYQNNFSSTGATFNNATITRGYGWELNNSETNIVNTFDYTGLIGLWHLNNDTLDYSGNGNDGINVGADCSNSIEGQLYTSCEFFDSDNSFINLTDKDIFSFTDGAGTDKPFSFSLWLNADAWETTLDGLFTKYNGVGAGKEYLFMGYSVDNKLFMRLYDDSTGGYIGRLRNNGVSTPGEWTHYVVTYNGNKSASGIKIYKNDVRIDNANDNSGTYDGMEQTDYELDIGRFQFSTERAFNGKIDEVAIWNRSLSASEIHNLYTRGASRLNISFKNGTDTQWMGYGDTSVNLSMSGDNINYTAYFETDDQSVTSQLYNISIDYTSGSTPETNPPLIIDYPSEIVFSNYIWWNVSFNESANITGTYGVCSNYSSNSFYNDSFTQIYENNFTGLNVGEDYCFNITSFCDVLGNCNTSSYWFNFSTLSLPSYNITDYDAGIEWVWLNVSGATACQMSYDNITFFDVSTSIRHDGVFASGACTSQLLNSSTTYYFRSINAGTTDWGYIGIETDKGGLDILTNIRGDVNMMSFIILLAVLAFLFLGFGIYTENFVFNIMSVMMFVIDGLILITTAVPNIDSIYSKGIGVIFTIVGIAIAILTFKEAA